MQKYLRQFFFLSVLLLLSPEISFAQVDDFAIKLSQTRSGLLIVFSKNGASFSLNIDGRKINPYKNGEQNYLDIDGNILQYLLVPFPQKIDYSKLSIKKKQDFLLDYEDYEMKSIKSALKVNDLHETLKYITLNKNLFLFWFYNMPSQYKEFHQQCYLIAVYFDHMFVLNSPVKKSMSETYNFLLKIANSLKTNKEKTKND